MYYALIFIFIIIIFTKIIGIKGITIVEIKKEIIENDINKVADMIIYYQNNNIIDIESIMQCLEKENKKMNSWLDWRSNVKNINYFYLPNDMKIKEENNEIIIYYKKKVYNVNKGMYITS